MKLLFVTSYHYPSHPAQFRHGLVTAREYAARLGKEFLFVVLKARGPEFVEGISYVETNPRRLPLRKYRLISAYYFFWLGYFFLKNKTWREAEVAVMTQESKIGVSLAFWKMLFRFKLVFECHGYHSGIADAVTIRSSDAHIFVNEFLSDEARRRFRTSVPSIVLPNAVDLPLYERNRAPMLDLRRKLELPEGVILLGYSGRFTALGQSKGVETICKVVKILRDKGIDAAACCVGGKPDEIERARNEARSFGLSDERAILRPFVHDENGVPRYLMACDMLAYFPPPTEFFVKETSPMKLFEYMAARKPLLVSDFPSIREILDDESAMLVDPREPETIAERALMLVRDGELAAHLAQNAYEKVLRNSWSKRAESLVSFLRTSLA